MSIAQSEPKRSDHPAPPSLLEAAKAAADMLAESAKQHRGQGDSGHATMADSIATTLRAALAAERKRAGAVQALAKYAEGLALAFHADGSTRQHPNAQLERKFSLEYLNSALARCRALGVGR